MTVSEQPTKPPRAPLSDKERQQIRDLLRFFMIVLFLVIVASLVVGLVVNFIQ